MFNRRNRRSGFTLPEVLVTVAIVAVLAAMVVPAVTQQIGKGDRGQLEGTLQGLQLGVTSYVSDVRRFPRDIKQLLVQPANGDAALPSGTLNATQAAAWKGPYLQASQTAQDSTVIGFGLFAKNQMRVDANYLILRIEGSTSEALFLEIDALIDKGDGQAAGLLRWTDAITPGTLDSIATYRLMVAR